MKEEKTIFLFAIMLVAKLELKTTWQEELLFCVLASKLVKRMEKMCEYMGTKTLICMWIHICHVIANLIVTLSSTYLVTNRNTHI